MGLVNIKTGDIETNVLYTTSGFVSGYQRTNITTSGAAVIDSTGQISIECIPFSPSFDLPSIGDTLQKILSTKVLKSTKDELMAQGYKSLNDENAKLAEDLFPIDIDNWPDWEN